MDCMLRWGRQLFLDGLEMVETPVAGFGKVSPVLALV
jgi:hypothetical protein